MLQKQKTHYKKRRNFQEAKIFQHLAIKISQDPNYMNKKRPLLPVIRLRDKDRMLRALE